MNIRFKLRIMSVSLFAFTFCRLAIAGPGVLQELHNHLRTTSAIALFDHSVALDHLKSSLEEAREFMENYEETLSFWDKYVADLKGELQSLEIYAILLMGHDKDKINDEFA